jgi:hypothetical protein
MQKITLSIKTVCEQLSLGRTTVHALMKTEQLDVIRICGRTLITAESVDALVQRSRVKSGASGSEIQSQTDAVEGQFAASDADEALSSNSEASIGAIAALDSCVEGVGRRNRSRNFSEQSEKK